MAITLEGSSDESCTFMRLPYDVRALVYEIALSRMDALDIIFFSSTTASVLDRAHLIPMILRLNKEISNESLPFVYARNTLTFVGLEECRAFTDPDISGRALISRVGLPRMAMSRPTDRWDSLHKFLPINLRKFSIEVDTHSVAFPILCQSLCCGLEAHLKQLDRWVRSKDTVMLHLPPTKHLRGLDLSYPAASLTETQGLLWQRLKESTTIDHAAVERCFRDLVEDGLSGAGVFGAIKRSP
jgi:hypothetical protein